MLQHPLQIGGVLLDVEVLKVDFALGVVLTGRLRVGSTVLAEDQHHDAIVCGV
jgi:hypothetical protein